MSALNCGHYESAMSDDMSEHIGSWKERIDEAPIVASDPLDELIGDLERRLAERQEECPNESPTVALEFVLDRLLEARNRAVKMDRWLTVEEVASPALGDCAEETIHRKCREGQFRSRINEFNGKREIHIEVVAEMLGTDLEDVQDRRGDDEAEVA